MKILSSLIPGKITAENQLSTVLSGAQMRHEWHYLMNNYLQTLF